MGKDLNFTHVIVIKFKIPVSYFFFIILPFSLPFLSKLLLGLVGGLEENHASLFCFPSSHALVQLTTKSSKNVQLMPELCMICLRINYLNS